MVVAKVDGLPEVVEDGKRGICIQPNLDPQEFAKLGRAIEELPRLVYDSARDGVRAPKILDPDKIADAVNRLVSDPDEFVRLSR